MPPNTSSDNTGDYQALTKVFPWATYTQTKGALKLRFGLNDNGYLPDFMVATTGKVHEIAVAKSLDYQPGSMTCMDRGYTDYDWWEERKKAFFRDKTQIQCRL